MIEQVLRRFRRLAIALGATTGGLLYDAHGYRATFAMSAALLVFAGVLAFAAACSTVRSKKPESSARTST
ncbi:hypothetical protein [Burkholderia pyrrocinia]|uniref:hypothetical protein n=1 Tax=Burkholderia pyrrocinia TaxID=60550 RepID=UPI001BD09AB4|nr:hypothetical protein [Burkholderia pyrrocinia]QVN23940.1 hypothetical protein JYG32_34260 [Burkholderia pyrrocinia]